MLNQNLFIEHDPKQPFGYTKQGQAVQLFTLGNSNQLTLQLVNYGATLVALTTPDKNGQLANIVLGFDQLKAYEEHEFYFGCVIGRVANRISNSRYYYKDHCYHLSTNYLGKHHLHGGLHGFNQVLWDSRIIETAHAVGVEFSHTSPAGDEGYPGNLSVSVSYILNNNNELTLNYQASTDYPTPVDLTNHTYWNLAGAGNGTILDHEVEITAKDYIVTDQEHIPTGVLETVSDSPYDFRQSQRIGERIHLLNEGYDVCYVLHPAYTTVNFAARVYEPTSGRSLSVYTNQNGLQFYTGNSLYSYPIAGKHVIGRYSGLCLETQNFPDAINQPHFPSPILLPGEIYQQITVLKFS